MKLDCSLFFTSGGTGDIVPRKIACGGLRSLPSTRNLAIEREGSNLAVPQGTTSDVNEYGE